jgi:hypothetical protein
MQTAEDLGCAFAAFGKAPHRDRMSINACLPQKRKRSV